MSTAALSHLTQLQPPTADPIFASVELYRGEMAKGREMINLGIGMAMCSEGKNVVSFRTFQEVEQRIMTERWKQNTSGYIQPKTAFLGAMEQLIFGKDTTLYEGRTATIDANGGTNADYLGMLFFRRFLGGKAQFLVPYDSWGGNYLNQLAHMNLPDLQGNIDPDLVLQYAIATPELQITTKHLRQTLEQSKASGRIPVLITQNGPQNATGVWGDSGFWDEYLDLVQQYDAVICFDDPYPGMNSTPEELKQKGVLTVMEEAWYPIREAARRQIPFTLSTSLTKTGGQYAERVAMALINMPTGTDMTAVAAALKKEGRAVNSHTCKTHLVAAEVLGTPELRARWLDEYAHKPLQRVHLGRAALSRNAPNDKTRAMIDRTRGMFLLLPMRHSDADQMALEDPGIVVVKITSQTLAGTGNPPIECVRLNVTGIPEDREDEIAKRVMERVQV